MEDRPKDDDFEVVEEVIEDFDYFYEDEQDAVRNQREKNKLKILSILISAFVVFLIILFTGMIQMKLYNSKTYVSREVIKQIEYMEVAEEAFSYAKDFYSAKEVNGKLVEDGIYVEIVQFLNKGEFMQEDLEDKFLTNIFDTCYFYVGDISLSKDGCLELIKLPKDEKYQAFNDCLIDTYI